MWHYGLGEEIALNRDFRRDKKGIRGAGRRYVLWNSQKEDWEGDNDWSFKKLERVEEEGGGRRRKEEGESQLPQIVL